MITQPSTSDPPNKHGENEAQEEEVDSDETKNPNWMELPEDVWIMILSKLNTIDILVNAQMACMLFRRLCEQPPMFRTIDMCLPDPDAYWDLHVTYEANLMTCYAVDRSAGGLVEISLERSCDDETLLYVADRSKNLKRLVLQNYIYVSDGGLVEAVQKLPMLEVLDLIFCKFLDETVEAVGRTCPLLKSFSLTQVGYKMREFDLLPRSRNEEARAIARSMPKLHHLQLIGNEMTNEGLKAILDGCPLLEFLDLRACCHIDLSGGLGQRCERIKHVRYPNDSTEDYPAYAREDARVDHLIDDLVGYESHGCLIDEKVYHLF